MEGIQPAPSPHLTLLACLGRVRIPWAFQISANESLTEPTQTTAEAQRIQDRHGCLFQIHGPAEGCQLACQAAFKNSKGQATSCSTVLVFTGE